MRGCCALAFVWLFISVADGWSADVSLEVSSQETYVGLPIQLQIRLADAGDHDPPELPSIDGLEIESMGPPMRSSQLSIINGRRSSSTSTTYRYRVTPNRPGSFTIPPIRISAGGQQTITKAVRIVANQSETNDLMFVEIEGAKDTVYVGEALELTLKIWIRPFTSPKHSITLDENDMWQLLSDQTKWGPLANRIDQLRKQRKRPEGRPVLRRDSEGNQREYLLYEVTATVYPDRPGQIDGRDVRIILNYPESIRRARSPFSVFDDDPFFSDSMFSGFGSRLQVEKVRPIIGEVKVANIDVLPIPLVGRPPDYRGAVGQYSISTTATPNKVASGDPITLSLTIAGTGPMELVRSPPLAEFDSLSSDFKVADNELSGMVEDNRKEFTTTLRPLRAGIRQIPGIPFSYFDPESEKFVTVTSEPISIEVSASEQLDLATLSSDGPVSASNTDESGNDDVIPLPSAVALANDFTQWRNQSIAPLITPIVASVLTAPPVLALLAFVFSLSRRFPSRYLRERSFRQDVANSDSVAEIATALEDYLASRFQIHADDQRADRTVGALRAEGLASLAIRAERLYAAAQDARSSSDEHNQIERWRDEAVTIADDLKSIRSRPQVRWVVRLFLWGVLSAASSTSVAESRSNMDTSTHAKNQNQTWQNAREAFQSGDFQSAVDHLEKFLDTGIVNDQLFYALGVAYAGSDQPARSIAAYRSALRINPEHPNSRRALARLSNDPLLWLPIHWFKNAFVVSWILFWLMSIAIIVRRSVMRMTVASAALLVAIVCGSVWIYDRFQYTRDQVAIILVDDLKIRAGDGKEFEIVATRDNAAGQVIRQINQRAGWSKIELPDGATGWVTDDQLAAVITSS